MGNLIKLRHPEFAGFVFGDEEDGIVFGNRAGLEPFIARVDEDHPLLPALLEKHPSIEIVRDEGGPAQVWLCPIHNDREFKTRGALLAHLRAKGHDASDLAAVADVDADDGSDGDPVSADGVTSSATLPSPPPRQGRTR